MQSSETVEFLLRVFGALLTLGSAAVLVVLGRTIGSSRLNKVLYALIGFFSLFALLRLLSGFVEVFYALIAANLLFLFLDITLIVQVVRLKRAAPTTQIQQERAGAIDDAIDLLLATKRKIVK